MSMSLSVMLAHGLYTRARFILESSQVFAIALIGEGVPQRHAYEILYLVLIIGDAAIKPG